MGDQKSVSLDKTFGDLGRIIENIDACATDGWGVCATRNLNHFEAGTHLICSSTFPGHNGAWTHLLFSIAHPTDIHPICFSLAPDLIREESNAKHGITH